MKKIILATCMLFISFGMVAQTICTQYHRKGCGEKGGIMMKYDGQSKSAIMAKGQVSEFHMVAYKNLDYRITVCGEPHLGDQIQFKIIERIKERIKEDENGEGGDGTYSEDAYSETYDEYGALVTNSGAKKEEPKYKIKKELLYDNAEDGYMNFIEFTAEGPMSLIIEISVPGDGGGRKLKIRETGCVGVLIEHTKSQRTGF